MATHRIVLADGKSVDVSGTVEIADAGVLRVHPDDKTPYFLSPAGWWCWETTDQGDSETRLKEWQRQVNR